MIMLDRSLCVILGAAIGSGITYILMKKKCDAQISEAYHEMKEHLETKSSNSVKENNEKRDNEIKKEEDVVVLNAVDTTNKKSEPTDYTSYSKKDRKEERTTSLITSERFSNEEPEYEKITLSYFDVDGILADDYGDTVDIESSIGKKGPEYFELLHEDVIYIRNDSLKIDYEIALEHGAYSDVFEDGFRND